ncbi:MAG: hypothetical protein A2268_07060 [Candidatus Raymondbacteria bacterium RifOxyA12_full_50_37]|uniref:Uncharacterized protein n=1 Tax=Candidatus Raymondbacteria bacterium RIFOXYD12_FULL_49_13 TaxID=1817890 RepID=A0A1F7FEZ0_UNCRA|nr:MAG: hypothetical protein A2350_20865 [Candidatus Raymondbacteria bacterium RifOxyB12_full_50_8]OGJ89735.1 MAG: hypothetical protein A2268_07060 [Candidatus Raymondbacteria bacterium RifOxyA12_full_50_37]OGJ91144.1 MAG: hypothetical protein A2248_01210 [Candidatus Raymondbacteria bacterium RIFOXYA2_FULL_49_16]OGJ95188.1 MAG: hypothetical protein A2487_12410 [Candidatus Raymondbacteria bacterium RifOxyC12_full_50_8]OGJ97542.1 MAG: hypothetical protein A2453_01975 [Candidatus Raymondbacteria b
MKVTVTTDQYKSLLHLVYLGNWMANSYRETPLDEFDKIEEFIFSLAPAAGLDEWVTFSHEDNRLHASEGFDETLMEFLDDYDENTFWESFVQRMARRDLEREVGVDTVIALAPDALQEKLQPHVERWAQEIDENGLERIVVEKGS